MRFPRGHRPFRRAAAALVVLAGLVLLVGREQAKSTETRSGDAQRAEHARRLEAARDRFFVLAGRMSEAAKRAAALPEARQALRGDRSGLPGLFRSLESLGSGPDAPGLAIHSLPFSKVAWARPTADLAGLEERIGTEGGLVILAGSVTTTLLAASPIPGSDGRPLGLATAETPLRVERNIENAYLRDFDRVKGEDPLLEVEYFDLRRPEPDDSTSPAGGLVLRDPGGKALAALSLRPGPHDETASRVRLLAARLASSLLLAGLLVAAAFGGYGLRGLALLALAARTAVSLLGPPWPFAAAGAGAVPGLRDLGGLLATPTDLFLTATVSAVLAAALLKLALGGSPSRPSLLGAAASAFLALPLMGLAFALVGHVVAQSPHDLAAASLFPRSTAHLAMQLALLLLLGAALLLLVAVLSQGGPLPESPSARLKRSLLWTVVGGLAILLWPRDLVGLPLAPALLFFLLALLLAGTHGRWRAWLLTASPGARAVAAMLGVALLSLLLHPTLVHFGEKAQRRRIEGRYAEVIRQSSWRSDRLREAQSEVDLLNVLEETPPRRPLPGEEELAFWIWSSTSLHGTGVASAVEVQDKSGAVISRFALDLPVLLATVPSRGLPREDAWAVTRDELQVASAERRVLHARRRLVYHGEVRGAVHLYLGDDAWDLPFLPRRDPMSALYRSAPEGPAREESLELAVFAPPSRVLFASAERPPGLTPALLQRLEASPEGLWTTLPVDGRRQHTYLLAQGGAVYAISYPRPSVGAFLAGLAEAVACLGGVALLVILALMLVRTALGRESLSLPSLVTAVRERFALRLFVSFAAAAVLPVAFLEFAFRGYVADRLRRESEDQALERAAVAQRAVDDFSFYQRGEGPDRAAVTDSALVWVSRLIRGDLDVFRGGQLLASSKRELFSSGLLPSTVPGPVFRALTLEGALSVLRTERIGGFSALVAYVPVRLDGLEPGILALPLAVKEREVQATLEDFDRSMRLATLAFLAVAAGLALPLSRAISGPLRDLTRATRRVARGDLKARVETGNRDEIKDLVDSFNQMAGDLDRQRTDLERSNRLAAWAEMARQVAHEVKNPLTPIQLSTEHLQRVWRDGAPDFGATLATCTDTILRQVRTLRGIVTEFSAFARPPAPEPESVDPGRLVEEAVRPYRGALPPGVRLDLEVEAGLPKLRLDRRLVVRAVLNLVENALHAVGDEGLITVRVRGTGKEAVAILVEDDGPGLSPEALARAFEPFFSTKSDGSGLGLALVRRVAEDHGGSITLAGPAGGPTVATLLFPLDRATTGVPAEPTASVVAPEEEDATLGARK